MKIGLEKYMEKKQLKLLLINKKGVAFMNKILKLIKAYLIDLFLWSYSALVCYKFIYEKIILNLRYPDFNWTQIFIAIFIGAAIALIFFFIKGFSIGKRAMEIYVPLETDTISKKIYVILANIILIVTFWVGLYISQVSLTEFFSDSGIDGAKRIFSAMLQPNFSIFESTIFAAIETIYMALIATTFAIPIAFILSFLSARNLMRHNAFGMFVYYSMRFILNITRSIEPLVWAIVFSVWVGIGPFAGMLALMIHSIASLAKLYSEQIEHIDEGPLDAIMSTGAHPVQVVWFGVVPQIINPFLSFTIYRWDINVRMATIIGLVGGGGLGTLLMQYQGLAKWHEVGLIIIIIASIVWIMDYASAKIREALN
jgi:phosphonate transport system permease protein